MGPLGTSTPTGWFVGWAGGERDNHDKRCGHRWGDRAESECGLEFRFGRRNRPGPWVNGNLIRNTYTTGQ